MGIGGGRGRSWKDDELHSTAISFDVAGAIQLVGFNPNDNIVRQLRWTEGFPLDFVSEVAEARVWDNVPFKQTNAPLVDGDAQTSSENRFKEFGVLQAAGPFSSTWARASPSIALRFFPRPEGADSRGRPFADDFIRGYKIQVSDGVSFTPENLPVYNLLTQVDFTTESVAQVPFPLQFVRYIQLNVTLDQPL